MELTVDEGRAHNRLYRRGSVAAHVMASPGRVLVAFPAGNSGAALWLTPAVDMTVEGPLVPHERGIGAQPRRPACTVRPDRPAVDVHVQRPARDGALHRGLRQDQQPFDAKAVARLPGRGLHAAEPDVGGFAEAQFAPRAAPHKLAQRGRTAVALDDAPGAIAGG